MNCVLVRSIRLLKEVLQNFTPKPLRPISVKKLAGVLEQTFIGQMTGYLAQNPKHQDKEEERGARFHGE